MDRGLIRSGARRYGRHLGMAATVVTVAVLTVRAPRAEGVDQRSTFAMERYVTRPAIAHQYHASRRLEASGSGLRAWLDAETTFRVATGFQYEVTGEGGSGFIRSRLLRSLLDEEQRLVATGSGPRVAISPANYQFTPNGINEEGLAVVALKPLRKDRALIVGHMFLTPLEGHLVRVEGRLAKNPSFWISRVNVVRSYRPINGVMMPVLLETTAQLRLLGSSELRMTYRYSHIDEQPVSDEP
jgi:hypothetical protein